MNGLKQALGQHPNVGDIRGRGLLIGLEFVKIGKQRLHLIPL